MQRTKRASVQAPHLQYSCPRTHFRVHHSHINTLTVGEAENRVRGRLRTFSIVHYYTVCALWLAAHISPLSLIFPSAASLAALSPTHKYQHTAFFPPFTPFSSLPTWVLFFSSFLVIYLCLLGFFDQFVCFISPGATLSLKLRLTLSLNSPAFLCFCGVF